MKVSWTAWSVVLGIIISFNALHSDSVALLKALTVFHTPQRLMRTVLGHVVVILTN